jgi:transposase-like protein
LAPAGNTGSKKKIDAPSIPVIDQTMQHIESLKALRASLLKNYQASKEDLLDQIKEIDDELAKDRVSFQDVCSKCESNETANTFLDKKRSFKDLLEDEAAKIRFEIEQMENLEEAKGKEKEERKEKERSEGDEESKSPAESALRRSYSTELKARVLNLINTWGIAKTHKKTGIPETNLKRWRAKGPERKKGSGRKILHPNLEAHMINYITDLRNKKIAVSVKKLISRARTYCRTHQIKDLKLSNGWVYKFCHRHNLVRRRKTTTTVKNNENLDSTIFAFKKRFVEEVLEGEDYDHDHVINFDETSIARDAVGAYTLEKRGSKTVAVATTGSEKTNYTMGLSVTLTGERLRAILIWPGTGERSKKQVIPDNLYLYYREKSWMNADLLLKWVNDILFKRKRKIKDGKKGLLILDTVSFHQDQRVSITISTKTLIKY